MPHHPVALLGQLSDTTDHVGHVVQLTLEVRKERHCHGGRRNTRHVQCRTGSSFMIALSGKPGT